MTRPMESADLSLLIGVLATCEGTIMSGDGDELASSLLQRWQGQGVLGPDAGEREVRQVLNDLNHRVRYAKLEYDAPPASTPVPD